MDTDNLKKAARNIFQGSALIIIILNFCLAFIFYAPGDLDCFLSSGKAARSGQNPYKAYAIHYSSADNPAYNVNPPASLLIFAPLSVYDLRDIYLPWTAISLFTYFLSVLILARQYKPTVNEFTWVMAMSCIGTTLSVGQIYMPLLLAVVIAWICLENRRDTSAGFVLGLLASIKPNFLVWIVLLLLDRRYKSVVVSLITFVIISILPALIWGLSVYTQWFVLAGTEVSSSGNASVFGILNRIGLPSLGLPTALFLLLGTAGWCFFTKPPIFRINSISILFSILASPIGWVVYTIWTIPIFLTQSKWSIRLWIALSIFMFPIGLIMVLGSKSNPSYIPIL